MRNNIRGQSSTSIGQAISLSYVLIQTRRVVQKTWITTLLVSLANASGLWFAQAVHIPQIAQAETLSYNITIDRQPNETYENLVERAEAAARAAVANTARSRQASDVSITVIAHNRGAIAPVLNLKLSRTQNSPKGDITYFDQARSLLRFEEDVATSDGNSNNSNSSSGTQRRSTRLSGQTQNANPGSIKRGFGSNDGSFSQPGRVVTPTTSGQPTNTIPSNQTGTTNPSTPTGQTSNTGSGLTTPSSTPSTSPLPETGLTPASPSSTPSNTPQVQNSNSSGTNLTPQAPVVAPGTQPSFLNPSTPSSPNSTNSTTGTSTGNNTTTTPGVIPSSR